MSLKDQWVSLEFGFAISRNPSSNGTSLHCSARIASVKVHLAWLSPILGGKRTSSPLSWISVVLLKSFGILVLCNQREFGLFDSLTIFSDGCLFDNLWTELIVQKPWSALFDSPPSVSLDFAFSIRTRGGEDGSLQLLDRRFVILLGNQVYSSVVDISTDSKPLMEGLLLLRRQTKGKSSGSQYFIWF